MSDKRFKRAGVFMIDTEQLRRSRFMTDREAQDSVDFLNGGATYAQIEAYVWEVRDDG